MKIPRSVFSFVFIGLALLAFAMPRGFASAQDHEQEALAASKNWIAQIDAGKYDDSYAFTCSALRDKVPSDHWSDVLTTLRTPWGKVLSRKQTSHIYKPNGLHSLSGECMVITYDTNFQKMHNAMEEIILLWDDGKWRGAGYNAGPKPSDDGSAPPPSNSSTEINTDSHVKAKPNAP